MDTDSLELFSVMDELEAAIKPHCLHSSTHSREAAGLLMDALNSARFLLIHGPINPHGDRHALPY
jgi:hypothetical protein